RTRLPCCPRAASGHAAAPPSPATKSRRRRRMLIWPSLARELYGGRIAQACGGCQIGCCTAESRSPPPPGLWQRWVINRNAHDEHKWSAFTESGRQPSDCRGGEAPGGASRGPPRGKPSPAQAEHMPSPQWDRTSPASNMEPTGGERRAPDDHGGG